ncbi:DUF58 domain-containing protein [Nocardioides limicola]|uniref:DUF58 domain-containing protein n=1 Tax=Nocardioides limicola TaxID=2803368 RepID=UPI00193B26EF|nr:DUF58 domain-containing protein [Nocardioides sp. DJM-14]
MAITGRVVVALLVGFVPLLLWPGLGTVFGWLLVVSVLVGIDWLLAPAPAALTLQRRGEPAPVWVGDRTATTLLVGNPTRRSARLLVRDAWQPTAGAVDNRHRVRVQPGRSVPLTTGLHPVRRGDLRATRVTIRSHGPFGLAARQASRPVGGRVRSLPRFDSRRHLPSRLAQLRELDGRAAVRVRGQGTEFDSLREYVRGDDVRSIDWRASARSRSVVVRTWQPERDRRVVLVLDTSRTSATRVGDTPRLDAGMDACLLLAALASRAGDRVDFLAGDRLLRSRLRLAEQRVVGRLQETMADLEAEIAEGDWSMLAGAVNSLGRRRALVVLVTPLEPTAIEQGLLPVLAPLLRHHRLVLASVRDPELDRVARLRDTVADVYAAAAAEQELGRRRHTEAMLTALGVDVVDADADDLPPKLADHYLKLKARGLL